MAKHIYPSAVEWLDGKVKSLEANENASELANMFRSLLASLDNDTVMDVFQTDMDKDGCFLDLETCDLDECDPVGQEWPVGVCLEFLQNRLEQEPAAFGTQVSVNDWREIVQGEIDERDE